MKRIAIGNPKTVPAGRYAEEALRHFNLWDVLKDKLIFAENVRQVLDYVAREEVDAGLVYSTDAAVRIKEVKIVLKLPEGSHQPILYPIAVLKGAQDEKGARKVCRVRPVRGGTKDSQTIWLHAVISSEIGRVYLIHGFFIACFL